MLEWTVAERLPSSRLSCQLVANEAMAGLVLKLPETQA
jgi:ferredoxin